MSCRSVRNCASSGIAASHFTTEHVPAWTPSDYTGSEIGATDGPRHHRRSPAIPVHPGRGAGARARNAGEELRKTVAQLMPSVPPEFAKHGRAARKEMLLAIRSLIDSAIERTEKSGI